MSMTVAHFQPLGNGFAYYPATWGRGYEVTINERLLIERGAISEMLKSIALGTAIILAVLLPMWGVSRIFLTADTGDVALDLVVSIAMLVAIIWGVNRPSSIVRGREATLPRRSWSEIDRAERSAVSGWLLAVLWLCMPVWLLFYLSLAITYPLVGIALGIVWLLCLLLMVRWTYHKLKALEHV